VRAVSPADGPPTFNPAWFGTVFVVPDPPRRWPRRFAVVTAHNPGDELHPADANERAGAELVGYLERIGIASFEVTGASADLRHQEPGRAFVADLATAARISGRFRQEAFFWIEDDVVFVCTDDSGRGWRVGRWSERLAR